MKKVLVVCKHPNDSSETEACHIIKKEGFDVSYAWKNSLTHKELEKIDFIISIGGDGTALSASHYNQDKPLLAVNSSPKTSEGILTTVNLNELYKKIEQLNEGSYEIEKLERIQVSINDVPINDLALNEVFFANEKAYLVSNYDFVFRNFVETQFSSGVIFSTGTGSTAWFKSAGGSIFPVGSKFIRFIVREPYFGNIKKFSNVVGTILEHEEAKIVANTESVLAIDSIREYKIKKGDVVSVKISNWPLKRIR